jgi:hypothetical protein
VVANASRTVLPSAFNNSAIMVASYTAAGDSFQADKPRLWSPGRVAGRPRLRDRTFIPTVSALRSRPSGSDRGPTQTSSCSSSTSSTS